MTASTRTLTPEATTLLMLIRRMTQVTSVYDEGAAHAQAVPGSRQDDRARGDFAQGNGLVLAQAVNPADICRTR